MTSKERGRMRELEIMLKRGEVTSKDCVDPMLKLVYKKSREKYSNYLDGKKVLLK